MKDDLDTLVLPGPDELSEPPDELTAYCMVIYGEKGVGKTSLASRFPKSIVGMLEPRRRNLRIRMVRLDQSEKGKALPWAYTKRFIEACIEDGSVETVVIDTVDRAYVKCLESVCRDKGIKDPGELNDYGKTWREIRDEFESTMNSVLYAEKGLVLISHAHYREAELRSGNTMEILVPTCSPAAFNYLKAAADYAFYMGYHGRKRALYIRGHEDLWCSCGSSEHFLDPNDVPVNTLILGDSPEEAFETMVRSFNNEVYDVDHQPEEKKSAKMKLPKSVE